MAGINTERAIQNTTKTPTPHPQSRSLSMQKIGLASWVSGRFGMSAPLNAPQELRRSTVSAGLILNPVTGHNNTL